MFRYWKEHKRGITVTIFFHLALAGFLIYYGFHTPLPLPQEEALLINFGNDQGGSGLIEPAASPEPAQTAPPPEASKPEESSRAKADILTQDIEEAPVVETGKKEKTDKEKAEEELKRQRQAELEKQRKAELERKRQEELERKRREEEQRKIQEITQRTQQALSGSQNTSKTTSEGETQGSGNQGNPFGSKESASHTGTPTGGSGGVSYSLAGRTPVNLPLPEYNYQEAGIVVVEVTVDKNGMVTKAVPGVKGSTTLDEYLLKVAREAALRARFDRKPDAPAFQKGTITYHFILQ
ncbi:MAG: hypothetical protein GXO83_04255 [Chlorobi bacterium]|nr:hypothetical protein [Chlorobiota bacterium]